MPSDFVETEIHTEIAKHHPVVLKLRHRLWLFLSEHLTVFCFWLRYCGGKKEKKLRVLYTEGVERLHTAMSIERITKNIRDIKFMIKSPIEEKEKFMIQHCYKNVINMDSD